MKNYKKAAALALIKSKSRTERDRQLHDIIFAPAIVKKIMKKGSSLRYSDFRWVREGMIRIQSGYFSGSACDNSAGTFTRKINGCWMIE